MMTKRLWIPAVALMVAATAVAAAPASAHRSPTHVERTNITSAATYDLAGTPVRCIRLKIAVSTVARRFAVATPRDWPSGACAKYNSDGDIIVRNRGGNYWVAAWEGSSMVRCAKKIPAAVV